ncbi:hypothetical protein [Wielerella bovis]|uniref:hypothetical protein n=1 Tax=Wielerella bovis TaxID=2917790 RepID=UPI002019F7EF|nr:hypothetical protein [Wielerella bovis]MCG7657723.1 hypothetical protein [Wielerella bovis]MCG7659944.1 hypothetical protein [Wielerella bovis]
MKKVMILFTIWALAACQNMVTPKTPMIQVSDDLKKLVAPYQIGKPKYFVNKIILIYHSHNDKPMQIQYFIQQTDTPNIVYQTTLTQSYETKEFSFLGQWLSLRSESIAKNYTAKMNLVSYQQNMRDWQQAEVGTVFQYQQNYFNLEESLGDTICQITSMVAAKTLHPNIKGQAKKVECVWEWDKRKKAIGYYLLDYHFYLPIETKIDDKTDVNSEITEFE